MDVGTMFWSSVNYAASCFQPKKPDRTLDPIATLGMLALRTLKVFKEARPAARGNWLEFDKASLLKKAERTATSVSSDDLFYVNPSLRLFVKVWKPEKHPQLVKIVEVALEGLEIMRREYEKECKCAAPAIEHYQTMLRAWMPQNVIGLDEDAEREKQELLASTREFLGKIKGNTYEQNKPIIDKLREMVAKEMPPENVEHVEEVMLTEEEQAIVAIVKECWPQEEIVTFAHLLAERAINADALVGLLAAHKGKYLSKLDQYK